CQAPTMLRRLVGFTSTQGSTSASGKFRPGCNAGTLSAVQAANGLGPADTRTSGPAENVLAHATATTVPANASNPRTIERHLMISSPFRFVASLVLFVNCSGNRDEGNSMTLEADHGGLKRRNYLET